MLRATDFALCMRKGVHIGADNLVLHQQLDPEVSTPLVGFIVPKKFVKKATARHLVKRRMRHLMRERVHVLPAGSRTALYAHGSVETLSFQALASQLDNTLRRARMKLSTPHRSHQ